jgi:cell fate regulator YaaT (PSP1 superfamily)
MSESDIKTDASSGEREEEKVYYRIRFRDGGQEYTAESLIPGLLRDEVVMVQTDHGLEPSIVIRSAPSCSHCHAKRGASYSIGRRLTPEELQRFVNLAGVEEQAHKVCSTLIEKHSLTMSLVRVEKFFNGSKMIFYFTADNRVDFRSLVKDLVQEFRTRVEMRQVGVRHETKMLGGIGACGRELCCSSFLKKFDSVSIKMAKEQDLPLNPSKISGVCNRLLCCLTYEYDTYHKQRKRMPKIGSRLKSGEVEYKVRRQNPLQQTIVVVNADGEETTWEMETWQQLEIVHGEKTTRKKK